MSTIEYDIGESVGLKATYTDQDGIYDPDDVELNIYDPSGTLMKTVKYSDGEILRNSKGIYIYNYLIPDDAETGWWNEIFTGTTGSSIDKSSMKFYVRNSQEKIYCSPQQVWNRCGMDSAVVSLDTTMGYIRDAMEQIDTEYGRSFLPSQTNTQWFDTLQPDSLTVVSAIFLSQRPVLSITSVKEYDINNDVTKTFTSDEYWVDQGTGRIKLNQIEFGHQAHRIEVIYKSGYDKVPRNVSQLCAVMAGQNVLLNFAGASYDDVTSYSAAGLSISVGEPYMNSTRTFQLLEKQKNKLMASIGRLRNSIVIF